MDNVVRFLISLCLLFMFVTFSLVSDDSEEQKKDSDKSSLQKKEKASKEETKEVKEEKPKEISGKVDIGGKTISYLARTGTMPVLNDDGVSRASVFYVYYAASDPEGGRICEKDNRRPVMFCFNGGPGASAVWLHLGGLGPKRVNIPPEGLSPLTTATVVDNPESILDATDLVFVDPVSTGLSRPAKNEKAESFHGVDEDIQAAGEFIRLFITREHRWASPKFMCGESYGVFRVAGLSDYLQSKYGIYMDGLVLVSGLVNFQTIIPDTGNDLPYVLFLPNLTATAYYHSRLPEDLQGGSLEKAIGKSREFACGEYLLALMRGNELAKGERKKLAEKLARLTGLSPERIDEWNLRISPEFFQKELLRGGSKIIGRFDGRVVSEDGTDSRQTPEFDPSLTNVVGAFASAVNSYVRKNLGYESDHPYHLLKGLPWKWNKFEGRYVSAEDALARAIKTNPKMGILVMSGLRDLAVPEDSMRYSLSHISIPDGIRRNIRYSQFQSGHMMYLFKPDSEKLRKDILEFINLQISSQLE